MVLLVALGTESVLILRVELPIQSLSASMAPEALLVVNLAKGSAALLSEVSLAVVALFGRFVDGFGCPVSYPRQNLRVT